MTKSSEKKRVVRSAKVGCPKSRKDHFERIPDTPENIAKALFRQRQKKTRNKYVLETTH